MGSLTSLWGEWGSLTSFLGEEWGSLTSFWGGVGEFNIVMGEVGSLTLLWGSGEFNIVVGEWGV